MLARHKGRCTNCPKPILPGQKIGRFAEGWAHVECITQPKATVSSSCFCKRCGGDLVDLNADEACCLVCGWPA